MLTAAFWAATVQRVIRSFAASLVALLVGNGGTQRLWLSDVGYGDVSTYRRLTPGLYAVSMRPHNAPSTTKPGIAGTATGGTGPAFGDIEQTSPPAPPAA